MTGFVVFAHGSRIESANQSVRRIAATLSSRTAVLVEAAFLELGTPDLPGAVERLTAQGAERIIVIPYFLTLGRHIEEDLPRIVEGISQRHSGVRIQVTPPLDGHPALLDILLERAHEALT